MYGIALELLFDFRLIVSIFVLPEFRKCHLLRDSIFSSFVLLPVLLINSFFRHLFDFSSPFTKTLPQYLCQAGGISF